jgi:peroxiredoxin
MIHLCRIAATLFFISFFEVSVLAQQQFIKSDTLGQKRYDALLIPVQDSQYAAYKLLFTVEKGIRKGFNKDSLADVVKAFQTEIKNRKIQFVKEFPKAYTALQVFNWEIIDNYNLAPDSLMRLYAAFDTSLKETDLGRSVIAHIKKKQSLLVNNIMPDFSFSTLEGQYYALTSFRNSAYTLLCFWASSCVPCIESLPVLRKLDLAYGTKGLQLISVSIDHEEKKWQQALEKHNLSWLQTCDLPAWIKESSVRSLYDIQYVPQYFLINKEGKLIYHNNQLHDDDAYTLLQKMLKNLLQ